MILPGYMTFCMANMHIYVKVHIPTSGTWAHLGESKNGVDQNPLVYIIAKMYMHFMQAA